MTQPANHRIAALLAAVVLGLVAGGCGESPAPVSGHVTLDGSPIGPGTVIFIPETGDQPRESAVGTFGADGRYQLQTFRPGDGALPGKYRVLVQGSGAASGESYGEESAAPAGTTAIPLKYADPQQSGLTATVQPGENKIDFPLK